jgi:hypothetical protein
MSPRTSVLHTAQEQDRCVRQRAPGAADLLVVGHRGPGRLVVEHEAEVGLVEAHPEGRGGHERLHLVRDQGVLELLPALRLRLAAVGVRVDPLRARERGDPGGVGDREHVDHTGALE